MRTRPDWWHDKWFHRGCHIVSREEGKEHYNRLSGFKISSVQSSCEEGSDLESLTSIVAMVGRWLLVVRLLGYEMLLSAWSRIQGAVKCSYGEVQADLQGGVRST